MNDSINSTVTHSKNIILNHNSPNFQELSVEIFEGLDLSKNTIADYKYRIGKFIAFVNNTGLNVQTLLEYKRDLATQPISISTKNKYLISARIFLKELYRLGYFQRDLTVNIKGFKQTQGHKKDGISESEILLIQNFCQLLEKTKSNLRLKAILSLLIYQGLRQIEICGLDIQDIQLQNRLIFIKGKGRDDKEIIWLHPHTIKALSNYIRAEKINTGPIFRSRSNFHTNERLTTKSVRLIIGDMLNILGIDGTTHGFRHYFTTKLIKSYKGELLTVSKYTRHKSIQMLEIYNDEIIRQEDLPRYYDVFNSIQI